MDMNANASLLYGIRWRELITQNMYSFTQLLLFVMQPEIVLKYFCREYL